MTAIATLGEHLEERIRSGKWRNGQNLPSRTQLSDEYGVSPGTVSNVMRSLKAKGLVRIVPGKGVYVASDTGQDQSTGQGAPTKPLIGLSGTSLSADLDHFGTDEVFTRPILDGVWAESQAHGCPLVLLPASPGCSGFDQQHCRSIGVQGVVVVGSGYYPQALELRRQGLPVILSYQPPPPTPLSFIDYDNADSMRRAMSTFMQAGHQRMAVVGMIGSNRAYYDAMKLQFVQALLDRGLIFDYNRYWSIVQRLDDTAPTSQALICAEIERLLGLPEPPTAIYCWTPITLEPTRKTLNRHGLKVPDDLSLMSGGFATEAEASVSGFVVPHMQLGRSLIQHLFEAIEDPNAYCQDLLQAKFVDRASVVGPSSSHKSGQPTNRLME